MKYKPQIDSLRAIAIISVVLFHAIFLLFSLIFTRAIKDHND